MTGPDALRDLDGPYQTLPAVVGRREESVRRNFWRKLRRVAGHIPFAEDMVAAFYCALDRRTPGRVRGVLLAALAYFIVPADLMPDFVAGLGFTDDATVLTAAFGLVGGHIKARHRAQAREALLMPEPPAEAEQ